MTKARKTLQTAVAAWLETAKVHGHAIPEARYKPAIYA